MRDGRDAYVSSRTLPYPPTLERYAKSWKKSILTREKHSGNKNIFDIKYEELVREPKLIIKQTMNFLGEEYFSAQLDLSIYGSKIKFKEDTGHELVNKPITSAKSRAVEAE